VNNDLLLSEKQLLKFLLYNHPAIISSVVAEAAAAIPPIMYFKEGYLWSVWEIKEIQHPTLQHQRQPPQNNK